MRILTRLTIGASLAFAATLTLAQDNAGNAENAPPPFAAVQGEMLAVSGSLSNTWADFDNDGDLDYAVSTKENGIRLYRNDNGTFVDVSAELGLPTSGIEYRGLSWGDYDGDGWLDLYAGATDPKHPSALFRNMKGKRFVNVAERAGVTFPGRSSRQNNWIDYDNDGRPDLFASNRMGPNRLFRNVGGGKFVDVTEQLGLPLESYATVGACWLDYDRDGDLDLFLANQSGRPDALWRNDGDRFTNVAPELHMDQPGRPQNEGSVGCAIGDYDKDGHLDIFVTSYGKNVLWRNKGDGTFENVGERTGIAIENHAVGAAFGDYDNDGYPDIAVMSYEGAPGVQTPLNSLFHNRGGKTFVNVLTRESPLNAGDHGVAWADYDQDGALDLAVTRGYSSEGGHFIFRNLLPKQQATASLSVLVLDSNGRFTQQGAEVRIYRKDGNLLGTGQVLTGGGYNAQGATPVHFGLAGVDSVTVEVAFMGRNGRQIQRVTDVSIADRAGKPLVVRRQR